MDDQKRRLDDLKEIKRMMERSSRFISLSGWSGITAGVSALAGAWLAAGRLHRFKIENGLNDFRNYRSNQLCNDCLSRLAWDLFFIAIGVFVVAFILAFVFTYLRSKKKGMPVWGNTAQRLMWNTLLPMIAGGAVIVKLILLGYYMLIAPLCLIFYGLALVNGSKYTLGEVKYLGYGQIVLGLINLWIVGYGLVFWAIGFGVLHIVYGAIMWWKYERKQVVG